MDFGSRNEGSRHANCGMRIGERRPRPGRHGPPVTRDQKAQRPNKAILSQLNGVHDVKVYIAKPCVVDGEFERSGVKGLRIRGSKNRAESAARLPSALRLRLEESSPKSIRNPHSLFPLPFPLFTLHSSRTSFRAHHTRVGRAHLYNLLPDRSRTRHRATAVQISKAKAPPPTARTQPLDKPTPT